MINWVILLISGIIPIAVGALYYGPLFGKSWMDVNGFREEDLEGANMAFILGISFILSCLLAFALSGVVLHQSGVFQLMSGDLREGSEQAQQMLEQFMNVYGETHRNFGHGALHGALAAITFALPLIAINGLFERRGGKYIGIHFGYWLVSLTIMGGIICHFW